MSRRNQNNAVARQSVQAENETEGTNIPMDAVIGTPVVEPAAPNKNAVLRDYDIDKLRAECKTKSAAIRYLASKGYARADIARALGIIYQHVKNVLDAPVKTNRGGEVGNPDNARRVPVETTEAGESTAA
jgi:predicted GNAT superfamily acetyltransferase